MVTRRQFATAASSALAAACGRKLYKAFDGFAYIANGEGKSIAVVDLARFAVVQRIGIDGEAIQVLAHPSRRNVYALATNGLYELSVGSNAISRRVAVRSSPLTMRLSADGDLLWVLCRDRKLAAVDTTSFRLVREIGLPAEPTDFDLARGKDLAAVSFAGSGAVLQLDLSNRKAGAPVKLTDTVGTLRYRKDGETLLVANVSGRMLTVLEAGTGQVVTHLPLAVRPDRFCFNRDEGQLFITGEGRDAVVVVYPYYIPQVAETVLAGSAPGNMAVSNTLLFLTNPKSGNLSIMNINRRKVIAVATVGVEPWQVILTPGDDYVLVLNRGSGDMAVLRMKAIAPDSVAESFGNIRKSAGLFSMVAVGSKPLGIAVVRA